MNPSPRKGGRVGRAAAAIAAAVATILASPACSPRPPPAPAAAIPPAPTGPPAVAGAASCKPCHERFHALWSTSFHGLAMQPWGEKVASAIRPTATPVRIGDREYRVEVGAGRGTVIERGPAGEERFAIAQALGGKNVFYFLTPLERGFLQTLPVAYDVRRGEWYDVATSGVRHAPGFATDPLHWRDREYTFNSSCHGCHVSQLETSYDRASDAYRTTWAEPGINCETCHGPGGEHVRTFTAAPKDQPPRELAIVRVKTMTPEQRNDLCASCHARLVPITASFQPGDRYFDHFDLDTLESDDFHPDGRELGETYTFTTWRLSRCAQSGRLDCVACHTSSGRYRFRKPEDANGACAPCHQDQVRQGPRHTRHAEGSEGSRCVSCHMPRTEFARMVRTDHSMRPPAPAATIAFGSPNACNLCHADRDARWADATVRRWRRHAHQDRIVAEGRLVQSARQGDWARLPAMVAYLRSRDRQEVVAASLARLMRGAADGRVPGALADLVRNDPSPLVRAAAAESLGVLGGARAIDALQTAVRDPYRLVRVRAVRGLAAVPPGQLPEGVRPGVDAANRELAAALAVRADDPWALTNLGTWELERGDLDRAASAFRDAVRIRPGHAPAWVNLSMAQARRGDVQGAEASLRSALAVAPDDAAANLDLGLLLAEAGRRAEAEAALRRALAADPALAQAAYNLCALLAQDRLQEALAHCRKAFALRPDSAKYGHAYAFFAWRGGDERAAVAALEAILRRRPPEADPYLLLASIHREKGRVGMAAAVLRRAASDPALPPQGRRDVEAALRGTRGDVR